MFKLLRSPGIDSKESILPPLVIRARILKRLWSPRIDSKEWIPPAYVAWRVASRYDNPITPRFLTPIDSLKIPALIPYLESQGIDSQPGGPVRQPYLTYLPPG